jgi:hypothetical protein
MSCCILCSSFLTIAMSTDMVSPGKPKAMPFGRHKAPHVHTQLHESPRGEAEPHGLGNTGAIASYLRARHGQTPPW